MELKSLGYAIKRLREKRGLTAKELGDRVQLSEFSVSRIENGRTRIEFIKMVDVCEVLGVSLEDLVIEEDRISKHLSSDQFDALAKARSHALTIQAELRKSLAGLEQVD
jgi:transcriptional regulator with XRE-family HTH domain